MISALHILLLPLYIPIFQLMFPTISWNRLQHHQGTNTVIHSNNIIVLSLQCFYKQKSILKSSSFPFSSFILHSKTPCRGSLSPAHLPPTFALLCVFPFWPFSFIKAHCVLLFPCLYLFSFLHSVSFFLSPSLSFSSVITALDSSGDGKCLSILHHSPLLNLHLSPFSQLD